MEKRLRKELILRKSKGRVAFGVRDLVAHDVSEDAVPLISHCQSCLHLLSSGAQQDSRETVFVTSVQITGDREKRSIPSASSFLVRAAGSFPRVINRLSYFSLGRPGSHANPRAVSDRAIVLLSFP